MTNKQRMEWYNRDRALACEGLGITIAQYNSFRRVGQVLRNCYENDCNGFEDSTKEEANEREEQVYTDRAMAEAHKLNLEIFLQTDPRGATIYLSKTPIADNNYNRPGVHCIY